MATQARRRERTQGELPKPKLGYSDSERVTMGIHPQSRAPQPWQPRPSRRAR